MATWRCHNLIRDRHVWDCNRSIPNPTSTARRAASAHEICGLESASAIDMRTALRISCCLATVLSVQAAQSDEPTVSKDTLSVHTVERGDMPIRERATGTIISLQPPRASLTLPDEARQTCKPGQKASAQLITAEVISGKIVSADDRKCEIEFSAALPATTKTGDKLGALVETGVMRDVTFFERPANSSADSNGLVFVIDPGGQHARRVTVQYGRLSGALIQIVSGLSPGDRVIVTDTSKWNASPSLRLQ